MSDEKTVRAYAVNTAAYSKDWLDQPAPIQYVRWLTAVGTGDFGISYTTGRPVRDMIVVSPTSLAICVIVSGVTTKPHAEITWAA